MTTHPHSDDSARSDLAMTKAIYAVLALAIVLVAVGFYFAGPVALTMFGLVGMLFVMVMIVGFSAS